MELNQKVIDRIKDGSCLERLCDIDTVVFDKTGTLTLDQPSVSHIHVFGQMDEAALLARAREAGVDGVLTVDCPPEEAAELSAALIAAKLDPVFLIAPTTPMARVKQIAALARGYVYYVSLKGVTGAGNLDIDDVARKIAALREFIDVPIGVGFGIRDAETARAISTAADAVVVGSRLVQEIEAATPETAKEQLTRLVASLKDAIR